MSISLLNQVYDETRRLAIAGSVVAPGDFRIKKLIAPLEQVGTNSPVFAKVAEGVKAVVDSNDLTSAQALLDLTTLISAILYTQGETGAAGQLESIATIDLGLVATQTGARQLKPLLEALGSTGSGRLEIIKDAHERGAFRDLRLIQAAVAAVDDVYNEVADFVAQQVLPLYDKAILPALRSSFDMQGKAGNPRRLRLMHQLDPVGTRELVKQALDAGSKEVKVVAIECLGSADDDLSYLLEQATARAEEVRKAAYCALAKIDHDDAVAALAKALAGKDLDIAADAVRTSRQAKLLPIINSEIESALAELPAAADKKDISSKIERLQRLLGCLSGREDAKSEKLILRLFGERQQLAELKGATVSGADLNSTVVQMMAEGSLAMRNALIRSKETLVAQDLHQCFNAARRDLSPESLFDAFSGYLTAKVNEKKKDRDPAYAKRAAILQALGAHEHASYGRRDVNRETHSDPRWLDVAVAIQHLPLVSALIRPGHDKANVFLSKAFAEQFKKAKHLHECHNLLAAMVRGQHPGAADATVAVLEKFGNTAGYYFGSYFGYLIPDLPKSAISRLEELVPKLNERIADDLLGGLQQLRNKPE